MRVRNTSAIPLRAAYLHGPYTLYAACYPSKYDPNSKYDKQDTEGVPQFEPYLKAGGNWDATIKIPTHYGHSHDLAADHVDPDGDGSVTWVIEIVSQVIFSSNAAVHFELLVGRDAKSTEIFSAGGTAAAGIGPAGKLHDHCPPETKGQQVLALKGVYSKSIKLRIDDTSSLWNTPPLPSKTTPCPEDTKVEEALGPEPSTTANQEPGSASDTQTQKPPKPKQKIHLVVLTHGLHSNLGADMLYLKESIDASVRKSKECAGGKDIESDEQIIVRGFSGNAVRTERGIQYLGKRLAKYVLLMTYPDQPSFPSKASKSTPFTRPFSARKDQAKTPLDSSSSVGLDDPPEEDSHAYEVTSISFIGHSLGGLIQTYAIAYIQKHHPHFFDRVRPVNFVALATPFLGLSNENPVYVRFALDLGLVGRTGQDLGLSWTAPKVRSGWGAILGGRGDSGKEQEQSDPGAKPLLRILPCGPAHEVLHKFHHRTVYSNVVNDGIVPLRTSCLLFLDWRGLDRVEKARRGNGLVGTMAEWGWAELTGANSKSPPIAHSDDMAMLEDGHDRPKAHYPGLSDATHPSQEHEAPALTEAPPPSPNQFLARGTSPSHDKNPAETKPKESAPGNVSSGPLDSLLSLFRPKENKHAPSGKHTKIYKRSQTLGSFDTEESPAPLVRGNSLYEEEGGVHTPPKTTFFESAGDLLMPPLPPSDFILDPASRPRTIFHDRIYHPEDVPPPLPVKRRTLAFTSSQNRHPNTEPAPPPHVPPGPGANCESGLKVEEKIARAYHRDLSWRKVLVRLEPDAHNNIIVRRMFTNAYGWPVVKHLVDTHFGHSPTATVDDTLKQNVERAKSPGIGPTSSGDEVEGQSDPHGRARAVNGWTDSALSRDTHGSYRSETHAAADHRVSMPPTRNESHEATSTSRPSSSSRPEVSRQDSARSTDRGVDGGGNHEPGVGDAEVTDPDKDPALRP